MTENLESKGKMTIETEIVETDVPMDDEEILEKMREYRDRHPEEFAGTPEWVIKVTAENAVRVYEETGVLFWPM